MGMIQNLSFFLRLAILNGESSFICEGVNLQIPIFCLTCFGD